MNSVLTTLRVFEQVSIHQPVGVSQLSRLTEIPKSSVQRCLVTLQQAGWLRLVDSQHAQWGVTLKVLTLGLRGAGEQDLRDVAAPVIKELAATTGETVFLGLRDGDKFVIVAREESSQMVRVHLDIGQELPLRATSGGVAVMALLPLAEVEDLLSTELHEFTGSPVLTADEVRAELALTAKRGYSMSMSAWYRPHVRSVGAAVVDAVGAPAGAIVLSVPEQRWESGREEELAGLTVRAAARVSDLLSTGTSSP
jgi:IclR family acetate operon transcriptional repressor